LFVLASLNFGFGEFFRVYQIMIKAINCHEQANFVRLWIKIVVQRSVKNKKGD